MNLEDKLKQLPNNAGIYQYFDSNGRLLYIGKAKVLKNRVKSYFKFTPKLAPSDKLSPRIHKMITQVASLEWIIAPNEHDALILENSLIKQLKPKYNILLRDDKTYPYITVDYSQDFPRLEMTRKIIKNKHVKYFGPYSTGARDMLDSIYEIVPLVQKKSCIKGNEACLFHQIKKCHAPCEGKISPEEYKTILEEALEYIYNKSKLIAKLNNKMEEYSSEFRFEEAMKLRDRIKTIEKSEIKSGMDLASNENIDLFAIKHNNKKAVIVRMFIRDGKLTSSSHDFIKLDFMEENTQIEMNEAYERALVNYYNHEIPVLPKEIILAQELEEINELEAFLHTQFNRKIPIKFPKSGKKKDLLNIALNNCEELLRLDASRNTTTVYEELQKLFALQRTPQRVESFDNSHMMGQATVGAMVVWDNEFIKKDFRHYNLDSKDEYSQMREMLMRRVESFEKNSAPDLWVIDGGETLLKLAYDIVQSVGVELDIIAIAKEKLDAKAHRAKGAAKDILHYKKDDEYKELRLKTSDARLQFVQRQRDEAHRFVINFHKKQKRKEDKQISLLQIHGIGEAKVKKLLLYFGTFENIKDASIEELQAVLNEKDANLVYNHFQEHNDKKVK
jgi:excinuclease ABC subunit C